MKIKFLGAAEQVTGSSFLLEAASESGTEKILIDCGLHQGSRYCEKHNFEPFAYDPKEIKAVFITHAHIDHSGLLPKLMKGGFTGPIYGTGPTRDFVYELLMDSEDILRREAEREKLEPIYGAEDVEKTMTLWREVRYGDVIEEGGFKVKFKNAGHILGSSVIIVEADSRKVVFSGDLGNFSPSIIDPSDAINEPVDYCVMESTYGARLHEGHPESTDKLENIIEETVKSGGTLMVPAFAMERTQKLLFEINELVENGRIPRVPVFIDSPLAIKLTRLYQKYRNYFNEEADKLLEGGDAFFQFPGLKFTMTTEESKAINDVKPPKVIIAGSGMSNGGRILHHERRYLSDPKSTILFIGYQAMNTLGRRILDGAESVKIFGEDVSIKCRVENIWGYSAHADQRGLMEWVRPMRRNLKKVFLVHGEPDSMTVIGNKLRDELAVNYSIPTLNQEFVLE